MIDQIRNAGILFHILAAVVVMCCGVGRSYITTARIQQSYKECQGQDLFHGFHLRLLINDFRVIKIAIIDSISLPI